MVKASEAKWKSNLETLTQNICSEKDVIIQNGMLTFRLFVKLTCLCSLAEKHITKLKEELETLKEDRAREAERSKELIENVSKSQAQMKLEVKFLLCLKLYITFLLVRKKDCPIGK